MTEICADSPGSKSRARWLYSTAAAWAITYIAALFALKKLGLEAPAAAFVAIAPIIPFVLFLREFTLYIRSADELERRVQLEALAIAFPAALVGLMLLGLLQLAIPLSPADWSYRHVWTFLPPIYFASVAIVWRRYH
jgi:hypothetical protein